MESMSLHTMLGYKHMRVSIASPFPPSPLLFPLSCEFNFSEFYRVMEGSRVQATINPVNLQACN